MADGNEQERIARRFLAKDLPNADGAEMLDGGREERGYIKGVLRDVLDV